MKGIVGRSITEHWHEKHRFTLDDPYAVALGRAVFAFAGLEWDADWCYNKLEPGYIDNLSKKTAGNVAADLIRLSQDISTFLAILFCVPTALTGWLSLRAIE